MSSLKVVNACQKFFLFYTQYFNKNTNNKNKKIEAFTLEFEDQDSGFGNSLELVSFCISRFRFYQQNFQYFPDGEQSLVA